MALCLASPVAAQVRDLLGEIPRTDEPVTMADWDRHKSAVLANMRKVMGPSIGSRKLMLDVRYEREEDAGTYLRKKLTYQSMDGDRVPAWLLIPKGLHGKAPAMLALHQTTQSGKDEVAGLAGLADLHYGAELAERGYVVLAPDYPTLGEHKIDVYPHGWKSCSLKAVCDNIRGIDLLCSLPFVDRRRIGAIGHSLGGHNSLFTAAFDSRIQAVVTNCGFTAFARYYGGNLTGWAGPRYMPRIKSDYPTPDKMPFDFHDVLAAIAPRAIYVSAPLHDSNFEVTGVKEVVASVQPVYDLYYASSLKAVYPDCAHEWPKPDRAMMYEWLDGNLNKRR